MGKLKGPRFNLDAIVMYVMYVACTYCSICMSISSFFFFWGVHYFVLMLRYVMYVRCSIALCHNTSPQSTDEW